MIAVHLKKNRVVGVLALGALAASLLAMLLVAAPGYAESPRAWWGITSSARPTNLQAGVAESEVQEMAVRATGGEYAVFEPASLQELFEGKRQLSELLYAVLPYDASAATVQAALETRLYGAGNVEVAGGPGDELGDKPYVITFKGELADRPVKVMTAESGGLAEVVGATTPLSGGAASVGVTEQTKGKPDGEIVVTAENLGDTTANGELTPVSIADSLPAGLKAIEIEGVYQNDNQFECVMKTLTCTFTGNLLPYEVLEMRISVVVQPGAISGEENEASVSGGGAATSGEVRRPIHVGGGEEFGVEDYGLVAEEPGGEVDTQAGSHPFQLTTTLLLNETAEEAMPAGAQAKDLHFDLPPGLIGNPTPFPRCTDAQFSKIIDGVANECPPQTAVGVATITYDEPINNKLRTERFPIFNLTPLAGEPARFGFLVLLVPVFLDVSVRTGSDYAVTVSVNNITQIAGFISNRVTFWGVPGDPRHDEQRGWGCVRGLGLPCKPLEALSPPPFLSMPASCNGALHTTMEADSWKQPGTFLAPVEPNEPMSGLDGCNHLPFEPKVSVAPDVSDGSTPTGLTVDVHVPQTLALNPNGIGESTLRNTTVALPQGVTLNPGTADGLAVCSTEQMGFLPSESHDEELHFTPGLPSCPDASKVATVKIKTPLLPNAIEGEVYLAAQNANPFGSLFAMYLVAYDPVSGFVLKLAGEVVPNPVTGQIVTTFKDTPQLPFEELELHFFGGERAPLATPALCGSYETRGLFAPWSGKPAVQASSTFDITSGPNGGPCPGASLPFDPSLTVGMTSIQAGGFSPFTMTMSREDGQQSLQGLQLHMPPGLSGLLSGVTLCSEPQADRGTCGPESLIGETTVSVGLGGSPYSVTGGKVYITGPYEGAPFGISVVVQAKAGPYDLGQVVVRGEIEVDPLTAALTVSTNSTGPYAIPHILDGIPLEIKHVNFTTTRPGFTFNPTDCNPMSVTGSLSSVEGATKTLSVPFQVTNCATLGFKPGFKVSTPGKTSRSEGAGLTVKLTYPKAPFGSQANIKSVKVDLPKQLPSRLTTLQKACPAKTFEANPAGCQVSSIVGHATAITPLLPVPLTGPAYFVSYGGAKFPELVIVLQGYGVTLYVHGETFINKAGITSSTFHAIPDAPVGSFELTLPQGMFSALAANGNLCKAKLTMPTVFVAQNGKELRQTTKITTTNCPKAKKAKHKKAAKHHKKDK